MTPAQSPHRGQTQRPATTQQTQPSQALAPVSPLPEWAQSQLAPYLAQPQRFNLLLPALPVNAQVGFAHRPEISVVQIDTDPDHQEIYKVGSRGDSPVFSLGRPALDKIAAAAGISIRTRRVDDRSDPEYCEVEATGVMKDASGNPVMATRTKAFHMRDVAADSRAQKLRWLKPEQLSNQTYMAKLDEDLAREIASFRKHLLARTETGASSRVIRALLGLRSQWTRDELSKPFVLMRTTYQPDPNDPLAREIMLRRGAEATQLLFGPAPGAAPERRVQPPSDAQVVEDPNEIPAGGVPAVDRPDWGGNPGAAAAPAPGPAGDAQPTLALGATWSSLRHGAEILGLSDADLDEMSNRHTGDLDAMLAEINRRVTERDERGAA